MNIKLLRPADFNDKLQHHRVDKTLTVQKICKACKNEREVRQVLDKIWSIPFKSREILVKRLEKNCKLFEFEEAIIN